METYSRFTKWVENASDILNLYAQRPSNFVGFEGLPCSGKTTTLDNLRSNNDFYVIDEVRIPPEQESCLAYLEEEPKRAQRIKAALNIDDVFLGDRSVISTLAHKASLLGYGLSDSFGLELSRLEELASEGSIFLPHEVLLFEVSINTSKKRQEVRNRDELEGRLWYDENFLNFIKESTDYFLLSIYEEEKVHNVDSETLTLEQMHDLVKIKVDDVYRRLRENESNTGK